MAVLTSKPKMQLLKYING
uniref:Uncharacterized protein n=1 Tax=Anguilla anguilla TaxID=7936 RepID=A0A0E9SH77_ANGAN